MATKQSNKRPLALSPADKLLSFVYFSDQADVCSTAVVLFDGTFAWSYVGTGDGNNKEVILMLFYYICSTFTYLLCHRSALDSFM